MVNPRVLIVTPARNEAHNLPKLADSLKSQSVRFIALWIIVDDDSEDNTIEVISRLSVPFESAVHHVKTSGKIIRGAAYFAWWSGVDFGLAQNQEFDYIMKLDADVSLAYDYFEKLSDGFVRETDILGGVIAGVSKEQSSYVPGPVKLYSSRALQLVRNLPIATGFDVMDEVLCSKNGLKVQVFPEARFFLNRPIGFSQGKLHGRYRNGVVCKWTGYAPEYFLLHLFRYIFRPPYLVGSLWMFAGFLTKDPSPYSKDLMLEHRRIQRERLRFLGRHPIRGLLRLYR